MSETTPGFDRKNAWLYMNTVGVLLLANLAILARIVMGNPQEFITDPALAGGLYLMSALVCLASLVGLKRSNIRGFYLLSAPVAAFIVAGFFSGFPTKVLLILAMSFFTLLVIALVMGDKADQNTEQKTIRFKLPW